MQVHQKETTFSAISHNFWPTPRDSQALTTMILKATLSMEVYCKEDHSVSPLGTKVAAHRDPSWLPSPQLLTRVLQPSNSTLPHLKSSKELKELLALRLLLFPSQV
jgi:hypothetical protein